MLTEKFFSQSERVVKTNRCWFSAGVRRSPISQTNTAYRLQLRRFLLPRRLPGAHSLSLSLAVLCARGRKLEIVKNKKARERKDRARA